MTLREQIDAALKQAGDPVPFVLTALDGAVVFIKRFTARNVREWWIFEYGDKPEARPLYDQLQVELFVRCCVNENGEPVYTHAEAAQLREQPGGGAALEEFYNEARRVNWLFQTKAEAERERERFFAERLRAAIPARKSSTESPSAGENLTSTGSLTK